MKNDSGVGHRLKTRTMSFCHNLTFRTSSYSYAYCAIQICSSGVELVEHLDFRTDYSERRISLRCTRYKYAPLTSQGYGVRFNGTRTF